MDDQADHGGPVAIVGLGCRFPGADEPAGFHDLTVAGRRMFRPAARTPGGSLHAALLEDWGGPAAEGDLVVPDAGPLQKLAAETTALALANAGLRAGEIGDGARRRAGLFMASSMAGVGELVREQSGFTADGAVPRAAATSSLHAVAAAAEALRSGDLDLAVAGGAELGLDPGWLSAQAGAGTLSRDEMRVYAADPSGLLPGEGCGVVVLTRSADARAAGMPIYAEIAGWSTVPVSSSALDLRAVLRAYQQAGIDPADIQLIEGEGTGTTAGDLTELSAFARLRHGGRATAALGAVSAGIGYTRAAAGVASLIKTALAMTVGTIPPGTRCAHQHGLIESGDALLRLPRVAEPWPDGKTEVSGRRLAAVNSLGTADPAARSGPAGHREAEGVHLVLCREAEAERGRGRRRRTTGQASPAPQPRPALAAPVMPAPPVNAGIAANPAIAVIPEPREASASAAGTDTGADGNSHARVEAGTGAAPAGDAAQTALAGATGLSARPGLSAQAGRSAGTGLPLNVFALSGADRGELAASLKVIAEEAARLSAGELRGLAEELAAGTLRAGHRAEPARAAITAATAGQLADRARQAAWLLLSGSPPAGSGAVVAGAEAGTSAAVGSALVAADGPDVYVSAGAAGRLTVLFGGLARAGLAQPAGLVASLAGLHTLELLGVTPVAAVGYSLGELTALVWAGCLTVAEAARLAAQWGQVLRGYGDGPTAMARVAFSAETAWELAAAEGLYIAAFEGPRSHVLAGSATGIRNLTRRAAAAGVAAEVLSVGHALHSPAMAGCAAPLRSVLAGTRLAPPRRRLISTITGRQVMPGDNVAELLAGQLGQPVLFAQAMALAARQSDLIVVAGPDDGLAGLASGCCAVPVATIPGTALPGGPASRDQAGTTRLIAALFATGAISDMTALAPAVPARPWTVPRMRPAEPGHGQDAGQERGAGTTTRLA